MKRRSVSALALCVLFCAGIWLAPAASGKEVRLQEDLLEKSGVDSLADGLDPETLELMEQAGVTAPGPAFDPRGLFTVLSGVFREKLAAPLKALAALTAVLILCRLAGCLEDEESGSAVAFGGALACAGVVVTPLLELLRSSQRAVEGASAFLLAAVPVYGGLLAASGSPTAGTSYSFLTLLAGNAVPILSSGVVFPALRVLLGLALTASVSQLKLDRLSGSLYGFAKWLLVLAVTAFSGVLSIQTSLNVRVDAAANKAVKLAASAAIPIVGSAFGDAVSAIHNSVLAVKSGAGAFGILAVLCLFAPSAAEASLWAAVCAAGQVMGDLLEQPKLSALLGMCASAAKMILAVLCAVCIVAVVSAAVVLFAGGS